MSTFYVRMSGALPGGEQWNSGYHVTGTDGIATLITDAVAGAAILWSGDGGPTPGIASHYTSTTGLSSVVAYHLDESDGKAIERGEGIPSHVGGGSGSPLPQEVAVCISLRTLVPGPRGRGRAYMPAPIVGDVLATGRFDSLACGDFATSYAAMLQYMASQGWTACLFTPGQASRDITSVDVGDVFDAQRRRRDKLVEVRTSHIV